MAVLRASAGLDGDDAFHLNVFAAVFQTHFVRQLQGGRQGFVRQPEDLDKLVLREADAIFEDLPAGGFEDFVAGGRGLCRDRH